jgi:photosystem II stability/assembly factor-like uncharacterized protein
VGVVATENPQSGCGGVFLTTDFVHWRSITPAVKNPAHWGKGLCAYAWSDAYFISPTDGWLVATNGADVDSILRHTVNGGRTWITEPDESTGSAGGWDTITFVNATLGWREQFGQGSNGNYALERTENAGTTWTTRSSDPKGSCNFANDVFSSPLVGFASVSWDSVLNPTHLWRTTNGGVTWSTITFSPPPSLRSSTLGLYGEPEFSGTTGVVPVDYSVGGHQSIYFYVSGNGGETWALDSRMKPIGVGERLAINRRNAGAQSCFGPVTSSHVAIVAPASSTTWWILQPGPKGSTKRVVAINNGAGTSTYQMKGLPATTGHLQIAALNANDALLTFPIPSGYQLTYETSDGGVKWEKVSRLSNISTESDETPHCATSNLQITLGRSGAALGHIGLDFYVKNVGTRACELDGYPTVQLIGNTMNLIPTVVTFGSDYTVPPVVSRSIILKPGNRSVFLLGYADETGYGNDTCPTATTLRITPPGDLASKDLRVKIQAYGGATIQQLVCGEIAVSPIMSLTTWKHLN